MLTRLLWTGTAGAVLIAASSWWVGAVPNSFQTHPPAMIDWLPISGAVPRIAYYGGLFVLIASWIVLGRRILAAREPLPAGALTRLGVAWMIPFLAAMPIGSRDLWAYAAQGNLSAHGLSPYTHGPSALPGVFADNVSLRWIDATSPYGPVWLLIGRVVAAVTGDHVQAAVFVLRLPVFAGALLLLWAVPRLADRTGARPDRAVWLAVVNPLVLVLGLAGGHNDVLMTGLMAAGVLCAVRPGPLLRTLATGAALMAVAAAIKSPAAIGVAFLVPIWLRYHPTAPARGKRRTESLRAVTTTAVAAGASLVGFAVLSLISGYGLGWVKQVNSSAPVVNWMSLPTAMAMLVKLGHGTTAGVKTIDDAMEHWRTAGLVLAAVLIGAAWLAATAAECGWRRRRIEPVPLFGLALLVIIVLGPAVQPWYFGWLLPFVAGGRWDRTRTSAAIGVSVWLVLMIRPLGTGVQMEPMLFAVTALGAAVGVVAYRALAPEQPDVTRPPTPIRPRS